MCEPQGTEMGQAQFPHMSTVDPQNSTQQQDNVVTGQSIPVYFSWRGRRPRARRKKDVGQSRMRDTGTKDRVGQTNSLGTPINLDIDQIDLNPDGAGLRPKEQDHADQTQTPIPNTQ